MQDNISISETKTDKDRRTLKTFFDRRIFGGVPSDAVPLSSFDYATEAYFLQATDTTGRLLGGTLSCVSSPVMLGRYGKIPLAFVQDNINSSHKIKELNFIAIDSEFRNKGLGSLLLKKLEEKCKEDGVLILFGSAIAKNSDVPELKKFYEKNGYSITKNLPNFFGLAWFLPFEVPDFYFYKEI